MRKIFSLMILGIFCLSLVSASSIKTTRSDCIPTNENHYNVGDDVYIRGDNFAAGNYEWEIEGVGGSENSQASCDPDEEVASGNYTVNASGDFCFNAYTVQPGDCKEYKVIFDKNKHDNYHVIPEFGAVVGVLTILSALGVFFVIRRR